MGLRYSILDPTGNITALVEEPVEIARRPAAADSIMRLHPEVEQVGFLRAAVADGLPELRMAGGEFCGNASMCAAALLCLKGGQRGGALRLRVSGASEPVSLRLTREGEAAFRAELTMPPALSVSEEAFAFEGLRGTLPLVRMQGISHLVAEEDSPFFALLTDRPAAERAVRGFCETLGAECLGLLFLENGGSARGMTPLVYVPGSGTIFWENSCASGSAAVGMALAAKTGTAELSLIQPGGTLRVRCGEQTRLCGSVRLVGRYVLSDVEAEREKTEKFSENC